MRAAAIALALGASFSLAVADVVCNTEAVHSRPRIITETEKEEFNSSIKEICDSNSAGKSSVSESRSGFTVFSITHRLNSVNDSDCEDKFNSVIEECVAGNNFGGGSFIADGLVLKISIDASANQARGLRTKGSSGKTVKTKGSGSKTSATSKSKAATTSKSKAATTSTSKAATTSKSKAVTTSTSKAATTSKSKAATTSKSKAATTSTSKDAITSTSKAATTSKSKAATTSKSQTTTTTSKSQATPTGGSKNGTSANTESQSCPLKKNDGKPPKKGIRSLFSKLFGRAGRTTTTLDEFSCRDVGNDMQKLEGWGNTWFGWEPHSTPVTPQKLLAYAEQSYKQIRKEYPNGRILVSAIYIPASPGQGSAKIGDPSKGGIYVGTLPDATGQKKFKEEIEASFPRLKELHEDRTIKGPGSLYHAEDAAMYYAYLKATHLQRTANFPEGTKILTYGQYFTGKDAAKRPACSDGRVTPTCRTNIRDIGMTEA